MNADPVANILQHFPDARQTGPGKWQARCPAHDDKKPSLSIGRGEDARVLLYCQAGCATADVLRARGLTEKDLFPANGKPARKGSGRIVATYDYQDAAGTLLFQVVRLEPKSFLQRRPDGHGGWIWKLGETPRVLYRLPELLAADKNAWVFVVEGEKDADNLAALGLVVTTNPGGAGKWGKLTDDSALHGRRVCLIPDADKLGRKHVDDVAQRMHGKATEVRILDLQKASEGFKGKDATDWLDSRDSQTPEDLAAKLVRMADAAPVWTPSADALTAPEVIPDTTITLARFADVAASLPSVRWCWPGWLPYGLLTVLASAPGEGKSGLALEIGRRVLTGGNWPDGSPGPEAGPIIYLETEGAAAILADRVRDWGIPPERLHVFTVKDPTPGLATLLLDRAADWTIFEKAVLETGPALVIVDSLSGAHGADENSADLRGLLLQLARLTAASGAAFLVIHHLRKKSALEPDGVTLDRLRGSGVIAQLARIVWALDRPDLADERRRLVQVKNNLARFPAPLGLEIGENGVTFTTDAPSVPHVETVAERAALFLRDLLAGGQLPAAEVLKRAEVAGFGGWATRKAAKTLGIKLGKADAFQGPHYWTLPTWTPKEDH